MRKHPHDRQHAMTHKLFDIIEESTNVVGKQMQKQNKWIGENLCVIYKAVTSLDSCGTEDSELLLGLVGVSLWDTMVRLEAQGKDIQELMNGIQTNTGNTNQNQAAVVVIETKGEDLHALTDKIDAILESNIEMQQNLDDLGGKVGAIEGAMDEGGSGIGLIENKFSALESMIESKVGTIENELKHMKDMMAELVEQNKMIVKMIG